ncbi:chorismate-binding protein [Desulfogranum mediterraneum]|uniref:chorismate-binding protein n=1 Tax=Desulfogranum mediterraneum TaxID=160661 RepID=UPI0004063995|nr:bifunctional anthranilate synthase component I family protein/class IV aminotransferase [Desulfogranum mediterraneum]
MTPSPTSSLLAPDQAALYDAAAGGWLHFQQPRKILVAQRLEEVVPLLRRLEELTARHGWAAAGWLSYEAAPACDPALPVQPDPSGFPLAWFLLCEPPAAMSAPGASCAIPFSWSPSIEDQAYLAGVARIKELISRGDSYQVNYTYRLRAPLAPAHEHNLLALLRQEPPFYGGLISSRDWLISSGSPELFFTRQGRQLISRPMKGTAPRGRDAAEDQELAAGLRASLKNRAENVMIVDMVRNDLGRIARPGSVRVKELFALERYPTLFQLTSTVEAESRSSLAEIFQATFPPASITGAPKTRTMEIISELEPQPRRIYTGTMGFVLPDGRAQFNVAIRTLLVDRERREAEYGLGSGIVWDSDPEEELAECRTKARICTPPTPAFALLETMLWTPGQGYSLLPEHLERLQRSAIYFDYPLDLAAIRAELQRLAASLGQRSRVRLLLHRDGRIGCSATEIAPLAADHQARVTLAPTPIPAPDPWFVHKTTRRSFYEQARQACPDHDDVLLYNARGELTESTIANLLISMDNTLYTPPLSCGLLPGTARASLLARGRIRERVLPRELLEQGHPLYLVNSVRGIYRARYCPEEGERSDRVACRAE